MIRDDAFEANNGFLVDGGPFITGGPSSPIGSVSSIAGDIYVQNTGSGPVLFYCTGPGVNDWHQISAQDVTFDSTGLESSATDLQTAVAQALGNVYGKDFAYQKKEVSETTTGNSFITYDTLNFTVTDTAVNTFRLNADFLWGHNSAANDIRVDIQVDGVSQDEIRIEPKDAGADQRIQNNILIYSANLALGSHTLTLRYRPAKSSRVSRMYRSVLEVWRVE